MRTVKWNRFLSGVCMFLGGMLLWAGAARADISSTNAAAIVVFPKLVVDTSVTLTDESRPRGIEGIISARIDTIIQLTNTAPNPVNVRCFYVNANGHCSNNPQAICDPSAPRLDTALACRNQFAACIPGWQETDFAFRLTSKQPIFWTVRDGLPTLPLSDSPSLKGEFNFGSIPPAPEDPMFGELKCIEVGDDEFPIDSNDLKGEATIERIFIAEDSGPPFVEVDSEGYNALGIQAIHGAVGHDNTLVIGGTPETGQEYNGCPNVLILDHFFDDASDPATYANIRTDLTLVPCSEDFNFQAPVSSTVQFLVFNEFEQRFSTSRSVTCLTEIDLSDIDTRPGTSDDHSSIFNVYVEGTLTGQTLIRSVADSDTTRGHGLLGLAEEFHSETVGTYSAAFVPLQRGTRQQADIMLLPDAQPTGP